MASYTMPRGDHKELTVLVPADKYEVGAELHFVVKQELDNASDDAAAVFSIDLVDTDIISNNATGATYNVVITKAMTNNFSFAGKKIKCIGEFEFLTPSGEPTTYEQFDFIITKDANRRT